MIIEFIGSTGAGKTTLIQHVCAACQREGIGAMVGTDFVLAQSRLQRLKSPRVRAGLINLIGLMAALTSWRHNLALYRLVIRTILQLPSTVSWREKLLLTKNILKRIGIYEVIRRHGAEQQVYLVDEGTVHVAHSLFVQVAGVTNPSDLATFAHLVPLPHVVVYVQQDEAVLIERTLARGHQRVHDHSVASVADFVRQAVQVFDTLVQYPAIASRLLVVDGARQRVTSSGYATEPLLTKMAKLVQAGVQVAGEQRAASVG